STIPQPLLDLSSQGCNRYGGGQIKFGPRAHPSFLMIVSYHLASHAGNTRSVYTAHTSAVRSETRPTGAQHRRTRRFAAAYASPANNSVARRNSNGRQNTFLQGQDSGWHTRAGAPAVWQPLS